VLVLLTLQASFLLPPIGYALLMTHGVLGERVSTRAVSVRLVPYLVAQAVVFASVFAMPGLVHIGQGQSTVVPTSALPMSDEEAARRMREMIPPPDAGDDAAQNK
jgi:hypothetical protein